MNVTEFRNYIKQNFDHINQRLNDLESYKRDYSNKIDEVNSKISNNGQLVVNNIGELREKVAHVENENNKAKLYNLENLQELRSKITIFESFKNDNASKLQDLTQKLTNENARQFQDFTQTLANIVKNDNSKQFQEFTKKLSSIESSANSRTYDKQIQDLTQKIAHVESSANSKTYDKQLVELSSKIKSFETFQNSSTSQMKELVQKLSVNSSNIKPTPQPRQQPVATPQPHQQPVATPQPHQQPVATPQPRQQPVATPQPRQQPVATPQPRQQTVATPQPHQQPVATPQPRQQPVATPQPHQQPVATPQPRQQPVPTPAPQPTNKPPVLTKDVLAYKLQQNAKREQINRQNNQNGVKSSSVNTNSKPISQQPETVNPPKPLPKSSNVPPSYTRSTPSQVESSQDEPVKTKPPIAPPPAMSKDVLAYKLQQNAKKQQQTVYTDKPITNKDLIKSIDNSNSNSSDMNSSSTEINNTTPITEIKNDKSHENAWQEPSNRNRKRKKNKNKK